MPCQIPSMDPFDPAREAPRPAVRRYPVDVPEPSTGWRVTACNCWIHSVTARERTILHFVHRLSGGVAGGACGAVVNSHVHRGRPHRRVGESPRMCPHPDQLDQDGFSSDSSSPELYRDWLVAIVEVGWATSYRLIRSRVYTSDQVPIEDE
jgi:hypothetical protein